MRISTQQLQAIMSCSESRANAFCEPLNNAMEQYAINTLLRESAFLAQVGHESGRLVYVQEIASGKAYEGRKDLGNTKVGDGVKFKGRGLIQLTGSTNYKQWGADLKLDLLTHPELLETPINACLSAAWFWDKRHLNPLADQQLFSQITKVINGGLNGQLDRQLLYNKAKLILSDKRQQ